MPLLSCRAYQTIQSSLDPNFTLTLWLLHCRYYFIPVRYILPLKELCGLLIVAVCVWQPLHAPSLWLEMCNGLTVETTVLARCVRCYVVSSSVVIIAAKRQKWQHLNSHFQSLFSPPFPPPALPFHSPPLLPRVGPGHPLLFPFFLFSIYFLIFYFFLLIPFFHWLYLYSSFVHPFLFYQNSPTPFPGRRS